MRILSEKEMSAVFGGQSVPTLPVVPVTASYINSGVGFIPSYDSGFASTETGVTGTGCGIGCAWQTYRPALPNVPTNAHLQCIVNASAVAGHQLVSNYQLQVVNGLGWQDPNHPGVDGAQVTNCGTGTASFNLPLYGLTETGGPNNVHQTQIFAGGMMAQPASFSVGYLTPGVNPQQGTIQGPLTAEQWEVVVLAHEAAHENDPTITEAVAWYWGWRALQNYKGGAAASCH